MTTVLNFDTAVRLLCEKGGFSYAEGLTYLHENHVKVPKSLTDKLSRKKKVNGRITKDAMCLAATLKGEQCRHKQLVDGELCSLHQKRKNSGDSKKVVRMYRTVLEEKIVAVTPVDSEDDEPAGKPPTKDEEEISKVD